jgi:hypothetical protein
MRKRLKRFLEDIIEAFFGLFTGAYRDSQVEVENG